jgi:hypothetical protein
MSESLEDILDESFGDRSKVSFLPERFPGRQSFETRVRVPLRGSRASSLKILTELADSEIAKDPQRCRSEDL